jgi:DNA-binding LacI/PurR family transcriptional regulator
LKHEQERLSGYREALQAKGIKVESSLIWASTFDGDEIEKACRNGLLRPARKPSAIFTTNGVVALEALRSIYAAGLSTPDDIAFATLDEIAAADFFQPAITTVVEVLLDRIAHGEPMGKRKMVYLPSTLVVRASSSIPRRSKNA